MNRCAKLFLIALFVFICFTSAVRLCFSYWKNIANSNSEVNKWLETTQLGEFKTLFIRRGK